MSGEDPILRGQSSVTAAVGLDAVCEPSADVVVREIEGEIVIVPLSSRVADASHELFTLNDTGRAVWRKLDGSRTLREVIALLLEEFEAEPEEVQADVVGFVCDMVELGFLYVKE